MTVTILVGAQWGDEGKGKIVDLLAKNADIVVRSAGGANAGHTLVVGDTKLVTHLLPSGVLRPGVECVLGAGMVLDVDVLFGEIEQATTRGLLDSPARILVAKRAHVIMPFHNRLEAIREKGAGAVGSTKRGIGPAYERKAGRFGIRVSDLLESRAVLQSKIALNIDELNPIFAANDEAVFTQADVEQMIDWAQAAGERLLPHMISASDWLAERSGKRLLCEGAQGAMLDIDHGTYPYVTSSATTAAGALQGAGLGAHGIERIIGIAKAYTTRVGAGPFPTEFDSEKAEMMRTKGGEFGATTGRPRRCGWLDLVALRHAVRVNGITDLAITKIDILADCGEVLLCDGYEIDGVVTTEFPSSISALERAVPRYKSVSGWTASALSEGLSPSCESFLALIEESVGARVSIASIGPERAQTIER